MSKTGLPLQNGGKIFQVYLSVNPTSFMFQELDFHEKFHKDSTCSSLNWEKSMIKYFNPCLANQNIGCLCKQ